MSILTKQISLGKKMERIIGMVFIPLGIIAVFYAIFSGTGTPSVPEKIHSPNTMEKLFQESDLQIEAEQFVLQALKSPSTAKFPTLPYKAVNLGDGAYGVSSYVDSQNSFGAIIRSDWSVRMFLVEGHWFLDRMDIDGKVVYDATSGN